jgi:hypothetical protein
VFKDSQSKQRRPFVKVPLLLFVFVIALLLTVSLSAAQESPAAATQGKDAGSFGTCFLYRYRLTRGSLERIGIYIDGVRAVNLVNGRWVSIQVPAGHHVITTKDKVSGAEIDIEPGASYYIRAGWGEETLSGSTHQLVTLVMKEQAVYEMRQLKPLDEKDINWPPPSKPVPAKQ